MRRYAYEGAPLRVGVHRLRAPALGRLRDRPSTALRTGYQLLLVAIVRERVEDPIPGLLHALLRRGESRDALVHRGDARPRV